MPNFILKIVFNPLVWVGVLLSYISLKNGENAEVIINRFMQSRLYIELGVGATIYVWLFDLHYTKKRERIAFLRNLVAIAETMFTVFVTWITIVSLVLYFQMRGERISSQLRMKYNQQKAEVAMSKPLEQTGEIVDASLLMKGVVLEVGKTYIINVYSKDTVGVENISR